MKKFFYCFILISFLCGAVLGCSNENENNDEEPPATAPAASAEGGAEDNQEGADSKEEPELGLELNSTEVIRGLENPPPTIPPVVQVPSQPVPAPVSSEGDSDPAAEEPPPSAPENIQPPPPAVAPAPPPVQNGLQVFEFYEDFKKRRLIGLQQRLSNGQLALWLVENQGSWWAQLMRDFFAYTTKLRDTILRFNQQADALVSLVCSEDNETTEDKRSALIRNALPVGTLVLINSDESVSTYLGNYISDSSSYKDYGIIGVKLRNGVAVRVNLAHIKDPSAKLLKAEVKTTDFDPGDFFDGVDLERYLRVVESVKGTSGQFPVCSSS